MGFYGNITNTNKTTFQFDKVYPNRKIMDANVNNDGIFIGRYVLVEYQQDAQYPVALGREQVEENSNKYYLYPVTNTNETALRIGYLGDVELSSVPDEGDIESKNSQDGVYQYEILQYSENEGQNIVFYQCLGSNEGSGPDGAVFKEITSTNISQYIQNFNIDQGHYDPQSKGFKGYDSTVWVKTTINTDDGLITKYVHIADLNSVVPTFAVVADAPTMNPIAPHFDADSTNVYYKLHMQSPYGFRVAASEGKSDEQITWTTTTYNKETNTTTTSTTEPFAGDIYYNKAGFNPDVVSRVTGDNYIKLAPTAKSGATYSHGQETNDIQEFRLHLPAIGNMMSDAWDIIHGPNRDNARTDENGSLQGRLDSFKFMADNQIPVKRAIDGTLVGTNINGNTNREVNDIKTESLHISAKDQDDAWIRTEINTTALLDENGNEAGNNGISIHHTFTATDDTTSTSNKNEKLETDNGLNASVGDTLKLYTPIVDAAGHVVGKNTETVTLPYGYKTFKTIGVSSNYGTDLADKDNALDSTEITANTTQDVINIDPGNKWIQVKITGDDGDKIEIAHELHGITITASENGDEIEGQKTSHTNLNVEDINNSNPEKNLTLYDWTYDKAGHITSKRAHTYTLPYGYKYIATQNNNSNNSTDLDGKIGGSAAADNTQDILSINSYNKWIQIQVTDDDSGDNINIAHEIHNIETSKKDNTDLNDGTNTITVQDLIFDTAGHVTHNQEHTYILPYGYKSFTDGINTSTAVETQDEFKFVGDSWLLPTVSKDVITYTHIGPVAKDARNVEKKEPKFGETFEVEDWVFDEKGHKTNMSKHTVKIPTGDLTDNASNGADVITKLSFDKPSGHLTTTRTNIGTLKLTDYELPTAISGDGSLSANYTLNANLGRLEFKLNKEIADRKSAINTLYGSDKESIAETFDTIKEIAEFLEQEDNGAESGIETIIKNINTNKNNLDLEVIRAKLQEQILDTKINNLNYEKDKENDYYISSIKQVNGLIEVGTTQLPIRTVVTGTINGTILVNGNNIDVYGLKSAAFTDSSAYATAAQGEAAINALPRDEFNSFNIEIINRFDELEAKASNKVDVEEYNALVERVKYLEETVAKLLPEPETPEVEE